MKHAIGETEGIQTACANALWLTFGASFYCWELLAPSNERPTKRLSCLAYKIKPLWATSGAAFYCW